MQRVDPDVVRAFDALPVANVSDCMSRLAGTNARLRPLPLVTQAPVHLCRSDKSFGQGFLPAPVLLKKVTTDSETD